MKFSEFIALFAILMLGISIGIILGEHIEQRIAIQHNVAFYQVDNNGNVTFHYKIIP